MIECRNCGANCDPGDLRQGLCEDCRDNEPEYRILPRTTDRRRQCVIEQIERKGIASWMVRQKSL